jgi:hypothetical protein
MRKSPLWQLSWMVLCAGIVLIIAFGAAAWPSLSQHRLLLLLRPTQISLTPTNTPAPQLGWQVGAIADDDATNIVAMRTTIRTHIPSAIPDKTSDYFWIGAYLADGSFIQIGYAASWYDHSPRWFYCMFDSAGVKGACPQGPDHSAGSEGSWHSYELRATPGDTPGIWIWTAQVDGKSVGSLSAPSGAVTASHISIVAEQSSFTPHLPSNALGAVEFRPAIELMTEGNQAHFRAPQSARAAYSSDQICPPYGIAASGTNDVRLGSGLPCLLNGSDLW